MKPLVAPLPRIHHPLSLLCEQFEQAGVTMHQTEFPASQLQAAGTPQAGEVPFSATSPVLVSQDFQVLDSDGAMRTTQAPAGAKMVCIHISLPAEQALPMLRQLLDRVSMDQEMAAGGNGLEMAQQAQQVSDGMQIKSDLQGGPETLVLFARMELPKAAERGDLLSTERRSYHRHAFTLSFDNLLRVPTHMLVDESVEPSQHLHRHWNPGMDTGLAARNVGAMESDYLRQAIRREARRRGFDGIMYGDQFVQLID